MTKHEDTETLSGIGSSELLDCPFCGCDQIHLKERAWVVPLRGTPKLPDVRPCCWEYSAGDNILEQPAKAI